VAVILAATSPDVGADEAANATCAGDEGVADIASPVNDAARRYRPAWGQFCSLDDA
jgi:hypothetical protein